MVQPVAAAVAGLAGDAHAAAGASLPAVAEEQSCGVDCVVAVAAVDADGDGLAAGGGDAVVVAAVVLTLAVAADDGLVAGAKDAM